MKIENIENAKSLFNARDHIYDVIETLENEEITLCNELHCEFETLDEETVNELINIYKAKLAFVESQIEKL